MDISYDEAKNQRNIDSRGLSFDLVRYFDWVSALIEQDTRKDYGEDRFLALGYIHGRVHALVFTPRNNKIHVISLRKANDREIKHHENNT